MSPADGNLPRGAACLECRRRKMRCDGARPVCGQCSRLNRSVDCEYTDAQGRTRTQRLEETVSRLEARVDELQNPEVTAPPVLLHDPYASQHSAPTPTPGAVVHAGRSTDTSQSTRQPIENLIRQFIPYARQLGFFLNFNRIISSHSQSSHQTRTDGPHPALLSAMRLWIAFLNRTGTDTEVVKAQEQQLLDKTIQSLTSSLGSIDASKRIQTLQTEVLLAQYYFCNGRYLEGRYRANAAVSLAVSCGLHRIKSSGTTASTSSPSALMGGMIGAESLFELTPPRDSIEEGERIGVFWSVFNMDRCWSVATGTPTMLYDDDVFNMRIDTPWPRLLEEYERKPRSSSQVSYDRTVHRFLNGQQSQSPNDDCSLPALRAKASALFNHSTKLAAARGTGDSPERVSEVERHRELIAKFQQSLPPAAAFAKTPSSESAQLNTVHIIVFGAIIELHSVRASVDISAANCCARSAESITKLLENVDSQAADMLDPIVGTIWLSAARVFVRDLAHVRALPPTTSNRREREKFDAGYIARIKRSVTGLLRSAVLGSQARRILEILNE